MNAAERLLADVRRSWAPPPDETLSEWVEGNFRLSPEYSAQTGKVSLYRFQRGPLDAYSDPYVRELVIMSATQMLKTFTLQCVVAWTMAKDPGPILLAQPTETDAETFSKERLGPMIRDMECLRSVVAPEKRTSSANTTLHKVFRGGSLSLIGAQTAGNFARRSIKVFLADERDKWKKNVGKEGDGYSLGVKRTATFRSRAKLVQVCSPTIEGDSSIAAAYEASDQRKFWVPCPHCGAHQVPMWGQVRWDSTLPKELQPGSAYYECAHCAGHWNDVQRWAACETGEWRADKPFAGTAGFWINEIASPWKALRDLVKDYLTKKDDPAELQTFVNTSLAETWKVQGESPDFEKLMARREDGQDGKPHYRLGVAPDGVLFLTAGVDVQKTWLEGYVWGWGRGKQRWVVDHLRIEESPYNPAAWEQLTEFLNGTWPHESGSELSLVRLGIDTGHATQEVYAWCKQQGSGRVLAVDGRSSGPSILGAPSMVEVTVGGRRIKSGVKLWPVNVSMAKSELYGLLGKERPAAGDPYPAGWVHFAEDLPEEFFRQITAEQLVSRVVKGYRKHEWVKSRERNEALDCANYARAAAAAFGMDRFGEQRWLELEGLSVAVRFPVPTAAAPQTPAVDPPPATRQADAWSTAKRTGGWLGDRGSGWLDR